jgi:hypothetical protein
MQRLIENLQLLAIVIQFSGAYMMYKNSPDLPEKDLSTLPDAERFKEINRRVVFPKSKQLRNGFLLLAIGLLISFITTLLRSYYL